jgi:hypothetical protein
MTEMTAGVILANPLQCATFSHELLRNNAARDTAS